MLPDTAQDKETINRICDLIQESMNLDQKQVVTYNQMIPIPPDDRLFVAVGILDSQPYGAGLSYAPGLATVVDGVTTQPLVERQVLNWKETFSVNFMSRSNEARRRRKEIGFALWNTAAISSQEQFGYLIAPQPLSFVDASEGEGAGRLNRYVMTIATLSSHTRTGDVPYYDTFTGLPLLILQP